MTKTITRNFTRTDLGCPRESSAYSEDNGRTWRWAGNGQYCPLDACRAYGIPCNVQLQTEKQDAEARIFVAEYRKNWRPPTDEQLSEMVAAFGPGQVLVDVVANKQIRLPE